MSDSPATAEIPSSIRGALRLLLFDVAGYQFFTVSVGGFYRSFLAAVIAAPFYALAVVLRTRMAVTHAELDTTLPPLSAMLTSETIAYPFRWLAFPLIMIGLARLLKVTDRYAPYIIAINWAGFVTCVLYLVPLLVFGAGIADANTTASALFALQLLILGYLWFIARTALGVGPITAVGLVLIDVLASLLITGLVMNLVVPQAG